MGYRVVIPTAGIGSRLGSLTKYINKSLVSIANRPIISHVIEQFPDDCEFVIALGYKGNLVKDFLELAYPDRKFFFAEVDVISKKLDTDLVNIHIRVREGEKVKIKDIRFLGNKNFSSGDLRDKIETEVESWWSFIDDSGIYKKDVLKLDVFRLEGHYQDNGYLRVQIQEPKINIDKRNKKINISISIEEGLQYRVGKITTNPDDTVSGDDILKALKIRERDVYSLSKVRQGVMDIGDIYSERGYAFADINPVTKINDESRTVDVSIETDRGRKIYVG